MLTGIGLLYLRSLTPKYRSYKIYNPIVWLFVAAGVYISIFSFLVKVTCPEDEQLNCEEYIKSKKLKRQAPYIISLGFLVIGAICYYFAIYRDYVKREKETIERSY